MSKEINLQKKIIKSFENNNIFCLDTHRIAVSGCPDLLFINSERKKMIFIELKIIKKNNMALKIKNIFEQSQIPYYKKLDKKNIRAIIICYIELEKDYYIFDIKHFIYNDDILNENIYNFIHNFNKYFKYFTNEEIIYNYNDLIINKFKNLIIFLKEIC